MPSFHLRERFKPFARVEDFQGRSDTRRDSDSWEQHASVRGDSVIMKKLPKAVGLSVLASLAAEPLNDSLKDPPAQGIEHKAPQSRP